MKKPSARAQAKKAKAARCTGCDKPVERMAWNGKGYRCFDCRQEALRKNTRARYTPKHAKPAL